MKLKKLTIENFKGIKKFTLNADGENVCILGDNGTGKTTVADSIAWLLYDQNSLGGSLQPKPLNITGETGHGICSDVEGVLIINETGDEIKLKKSYYEKWTKKRGAAKTEFTGNITNYFLNDVPVKKKEYNDRICEIATIPIIKLLSNIRHFSEELHWQDRRQILLDICGDISDADIVASNKDLSRIPEILAGKSFEDQKKIITAQKVKLNKELNDLPIRIDEVNKGLPDMTDISIDIADMEKAQAALSKELAVANEKKIRIESGGEIAEKIKELRMIETLLLGIENQGTALRFQEKTKQEKEKLKLEISRDAKESNRTKILSTIEKYTEKNKTAEKIIIELRATWNEINDSVFNENNTTCLTCGQDYPAEKAQEIRETFNINKSKKLSDVNKVGKELAVEMSERKEYNKVFEADITSKDKSIESLENQISALNNDDIEPSDSLQQKKLKADIEKLKKEIEGLRVNNSKYLDDVDIEIDIITEKMDASNSTKQLVKAYTDGKERIGILMNQQRTCATEFEKLEEKLFIMEEFIRAKVSLLENKVNDMFKLARFKLFDIQVNGALSECCEVTYQGVPWNAGLNNGAKINVGLDIINTLFEFYGLTMPVFVDNAESVTQLIDSGSQIIKLIVAIPIKCQSCDWTGLQSELKKGKCPTCEHDNFAKFNGLVVR